MADDEANVVEWRVENTTFKMLASNNREEFRIDTLATKLLFRESTSICG